MASADIRKFQQLQEQRIQAFNQLGKRHWQTKRWILGIRHGRPLDNEPKEADFSA